MRGSRFPLIGLVGLCVTFGSVTSSLLASERFDPISVTSQPAGATVFVDGQVGGTTPIVLTLSRQIVHTIRVELAGYLPRAAEVRPEVDWKELSKDAFGGTLGIVVNGVIDLSTGKAKRLTPNEIGWTLERVQEVEKELLPVFASRMSGI